MEDLLNRWRIESLSRGHFENFRPRQPHSIPPPRPVKDLRWYQEIPFADEPAPAPHSTIHIVWLFWQHFLERGESLTVHHQRFTVLAQKESNFRGRGGISQVLEVLHNPAEIEKLHRREGMPDLFPRTGNLRAVENIDERAFESRHANVYVVATVSVDFEHRAV